MYITYKLSTANFKLIDNLIVPPITVTLPITSCADWLDYSLRQLLVWSNDCLYACCQWRND